MSYPYTSPYVGDVPPSYPPYPPVQVVQPYPTREIELLEAIAAELAEIRTLLRQQRRGPRAWFVRHTEAAR